MIEKFKKVDLPEGILKTVHDLALLTAQHCSKRDGTPLKDEYRKSCEALYKTLKKSDINLNK